ncbi:uncharacterized protein [Bos mutus]|uniref:uncharacterized protein n=1 Tax=Bos mutus TaxID=72004 RepID=UPI0038B609F7
MSPCSPRGVALAGRREKRGCRGAALGPGASGPGRAACSRAACLRAPGGAGPRANRECFPSPEAREAQPALGRQLPSRAARASPLPRPAPARRRRRRRRALGVARRNAAAVSRDTPLLQTEMFRTLLLENQHTKQAVFGFGCDETSLDLQNKKGFLGGMEDESQVAILNWKPAPPIQQEKGGKKKEMEKCLTHAGDNTGVSSNTLPLWLEFHAPCSGLSSRKPPHKPSRATSSQQLVTN